jgi:hypothetical protein
MAKRRTIAAMSASVEIVPCAYVEITGPTKEILDVLEAALDRATIGVQLVVGRRLVPGLMIDTSDPEVKTLTVERLSPEVA